MASHYTRFGWDCYVTIAGQDIPSSQLTGNIRISRSESQAALADLTLLPLPGFQAIDYYAGKDVTIDVRTSDGIFRVYTGIVDIPEVDIINKTIVLRCTDRRKELINDQLGNIVSTIGYYSPVIFSAGKDVSDELEARLSTIPYSVDFDVYGQYNITPWLPKESPDYTLTDSDVYRDTPRVELASRGRIVNQINISFQYRYTRLHHMKRHFTWTSPIASNVNLLLQYGYSLTFRQMIADSIQQLGWPLQGAISYTPIWPSGWYGDRAWSTVSFTGTNKTVTDSGDVKSNYRKDEDGEYILDSDGNKVADVRITGGTDYGPLYCMGASWDATTRWTQTITENHSIVVRSLASIDQYEIIEQSETYSTECPYDASAWENYQGYSDTGNGSGTYFIDQALTRSQFNFAAITAINKAKTSILASHRDTKVSINKFLWPQVDLIHTLLIDTDPLVAQGKVYSIEHNMDIMTGEATTEVAISLYRVVSDVVESATPIVLPTVNPGTADPGSGTITLGNHFGEDPTTELARSWNGFVGNRFPIGGLGRTTYTEQFIIDSPPISDSVRQEKNLYSTGTYNIVVPRDDLTIVF
jgi:hypothetical protein